MEDVFEVVLVHSPELKIVPFPRIPQKPWEQLLHLELIVKQP